MTTSTFDTLVALLDESRSDASSWPNDSDIVAPERQAYYRELFDVEPVDVQLFIDLRRSAVLRSAFAAKYGEDAALDYFEDFVWQVENVIREHVNRDYSVLAERVESAVRRYLPMGTAAAEPKHDWVNDRVIVDLGHPAVPAAKGQLVVWDAAGDERAVLTAVQETLTRWWDDLVGEGDITATGMDSDGGYGRYVFAAELAKAFRRVGDALNASAVAAAV